MTDSVQPSLAVEAVGLSKVFKDFWGRPKAVAVNGIDFQVEPGRVFGFLGPNGSGKSTTVKMLLGLLRPTSGSLRVLGRPPSHVAAKRRIGYLPEETYLYRYLTAAETLDFFGSLFNQPAAERRKRARQLLEMVGLAHSADRPVGEFSKGMARRIGLAQALINDPDLVILDEPTSGLDPLGIREVKDLIRHLAGRGKTVILCSHLLADVEDVCDHVMVMYAGKIRVRGPLNELLSVDDRTRIVAPALEPPVLERLLNLLNETVAPDQITVDRPSMDLEEFFMSVVRRAREEGKETAGAAAGGEIAAYLGGSEKTAPGEQLLEALAAAPQPTAPTASDPPPAVAEKPDTQVLDGLAEPQDAAPPPASDAASAPEDDKGDANKRLEDLLGE